MHPARYRPHVGDPSIDDSAVLRDPDAVADTGADAGDITFDVTLDVAAEVDVAPSVCGDNLTTGSESCDDGLDVRGRSA